MCKGQWFPYHPGTVAYEECERLFLRQATPQPSSTKIALSFGAGFERAQNRTKSNVRARV
jgi:hypothetical protein